MPFIRREDVDLSLRQRFEGVHKAKLRQSLLDPGLTAEQQKNIRAQLEQIGKLKVYRADSPHRPGAISFDVPRIAKWNREDLEQRNKADIIALAREHDVAMYGSKAQIIARLMNVVNN
jgi:hypothetical protein